MILLIRQAARIRRLQRIIEQQQEAMERMGRTLGRIRRDVDLLGACIPHDKRELALSLVRDRHRIEDLDQIEEGLVGDQ